MRKNRLPRLVLAATFLGAVSALSFLPHDDDSDRVDWSYVDETNPAFPPETDAPDYDGDGTPDAEDGDSSGGGNGDDGSGDGDGNGGDGGNGDGDGSTGTSPEGGGDAGEPGVRDPNAGGGSGGGLLGLSLPVQAAISLGLLALAFLALLPGRRMPANLR